MTESEDKDNPPTDTGSDASTDHTGGEAQTPPPPPPRQGGGRGLAVTALVVAVVVAAGAGGAGYYGYQQLNELADKTANRADAEALQGLADKLQRETGRLGERMESLAGRNSQQSENLAQFRESLDSLREDQRGLAKRMDHFAELAESRRYEWARSEAAYLASVAMTRVNMHRDVDSALQALKEADSLLAGFGGRTVDARQGIQKAIDALLKVDQPDFEALSDRLLGLSASVERLPLRGRPETQERSDDETEQAPTINAEGWRGALQRAWDSFKDSLSELVVIKRVEEQPPLLAPEQKHFLTQNLRLQLETARAALVREQPALYRDSLRQAKRWLRRYYDTDSAVVRGAVDEIESLMDTPVEVDLPRIQPMLAPLTGPVNGNGDDNA